MEIALKGLLAFGAVGFFFSVVLAVLSKKLHVREDPVVGEVTKALPGLNCGACGYSGCHAYAEALAAGNVAPNLCKPGGTETQKRLAAILKVDTAPTCAQQIIIHCGSDSTQKKSSTLYTGPDSCAAAHILGAQIDCKFGCLGFGDCIKVCPVDALRLAEGRIIVDHTKCICCGKCVKTCPRGLIALVDRKENQPAYFVACSNREKGMHTRKVCSRGCIACGMCVRIEGSPFVLNENVSRCDRDKPASQEVLSAAQAKCPTRCIDVSDV